MSRRERPPPAKHDVGHGLTATETPYGGLEVNVPAGTPVDSVAAAAATSLRVVREKLGGGAVHAWFPYPDAGGYGVALDKAGFKFRQVLDGRAEHYRWEHDRLPDAVPSPHNLIGGVTVIVQGLDGCVVVIRERDPKTGGGRRLEKFVSGAVDRGETVVGTALREVREEIGVDIQALCGGTPEFRVVNGYFLADARPGGVGDVHMCLAVRVPVRLNDSGEARVVDAESGKDLGPATLTPQEGEVHSARWASREDAAKLAADRDGAVFMKAVAAWFREFLAGGGLDKPMRAGRRPGKVSFC